MRQAYNSSAKFHRLQPATAELWNLSNWLYFVHHPVLLTILTHKTQLWKSVQSQWGILNQHLKVVWSHFSSLVSNKYYDVCDHRMKPLYMDFCFENYALSSSGINCNVLKNICAEQSRNLHSSGTELLKVENPKISSNPVPEPPTQFQNYAVHGVGMLLNVGILPYFPNCAMRSMTIAAIWWRKNAELLSLPVLEVGMRFVEEIENSSWLTRLPWFLAVFCCFNTSAILIETLEQKCVSWVPFHAHNRHDQPVLCILSSLFVPFLQPICVPLSSHVKGGMCASWKGIHR